MAVFRPPYENDVFWSKPGDTGIFTYLAPGRRADSSLIAHIYHGGHIHPLTAQEEADLIAAGYGDYIEAS